MRLRLIFFVLFIFSVEFVKAQDVQQKIPDKTRILFLLDGSGSMLAKWKEGDRIEAAKKILTNLVDSLRVDQDIEIGLRVYGHLYFRESQNCQDTRLEVPFNSGNHNQIIEKLRLIKPKGTTPIAYSLQQAANDFPKTSGYRNIIIIITDGIESCGGDPCEVSMSLQRKGVFLKPFVIGIGGISSSYDSELSCIGKYFNAEDESAFRKALNDAIETSMARTTANVELLNNNGKSTYTNVNVTFENEFTQTPAFDFIHYLDNRGNPDTVELDPVLSYDVVVSTLPPVKASNIDVIAGKHNSIKIKTPQGALNISQKGSNSYSDPVKILLEDNKGNIFNIQDVNTEQYYLEGNYKATVTTLPKIHLNINIEEGKIKRINIPGPGILNLYNSRYGYGSIYSLNEDKSQEWVVDIKPEVNRTSWVFQPGNYKIVFRSKNAQGSKYTSINYFTIESGKSSSLRLF